MSDFTPITIALRIGQLLVSKVNPEDVLYQVTSENIQNLPEHLREDPKELSLVLNAVTYYAYEFCKDESLLGYEIHDRVLVRLLPKAKTERYIESLFE